MTASPGREAESWWPDGAEAAVSLTFDDARPSQVDNGLDLLDRFGLKATFYVSPDRLGERADGWRHAVARGHEVGNHTQSHPCSGNFEWSATNQLEDYSLERMERELQSASEVIRETLGVTPRTFAYPCGQTSVGRGQGTRSYIPLVAARFLAGRGYNSEYPNMPGVCDLAHLAAASCDGLSPAEAVSRVKAAKARGAWFLFAGHEVSREDSATRIATLSELCQWLTDGSTRIWTAPVMEIADWLLRHPRRAERV